MSDLVGFFAAFFRVQLIVEHFLIDIRHWLGFVYDSYILFVVAHYFILVFLVVETAQEFSAKSTPLLWKLFAILFRPFCQLIVLEIIFDNLKRKRVLVFNRIKTRPMYSCNNPTFRLV